MICCVATTVAQSEWKWSDNPSSVSVNLGAPSLWGMIEGTSSSQSFGSYAIRYDYNVLKWLSVGGHLSYEGMQHRVSHAQTHLANLLLNLHFTYINREHVQLYSGVALGMMYQVQKPVNQAATLGILPGWGVTPIGVRLGGKHVFATAEATIGTTPMMSIGVGARF